VVCIRQGVMDRARSAKGIRLAGGGCRPRLLRVNFAPVKEGEWAPGGEVEEKERPPIGAGVASS